MAEQSAKTDCYRLKILSEIMRQESKAGVRLIHREIKAHKRVLEEQTPMLCYCCRELTNHDSRT